jgi:hypothetical protein
MHHPQNTLCGNVRMTTRCLIEMFRLPSEESLVEEPSEGLHALSLVVVVVAACAMLGAAALTVKEG